MSSLLQSLKKRPLAIGLKAVCVIIMLFAILALGITITNSWPAVALHFPASFSGRKLKMLGKQIGSFAEYGVFGAAGYWLLKLLLRKWKTVPLKSLLQSAMLFFKRNHTFLGWFSVIVAASHAAYFLLNPDDKPIYLYTGLAAFGGLLLVALFGTIFRHAVKEKKAPLSRRKWHMAAAGVFAVAFLLHLYL